MQALLSLFLFVFGFSAQAACPDVSGTFGSTCQQMNSCKGTSDVFYGIRIAQNGCGEVVIERLIPNGVLASSSYLVGIPSRNRGGGISSILNYTENGSLRLVLGGARSNVSVAEEFKKIVQADGTSKLEVISESGGSQCEARIECVLSERR